MQEVREEGFRDPILRFIRGRCADQGVDNVTDIFFSRQSNENGDD